MDDLHAAVIRAQAGDAEAFGAIYDATYDRLVRYLGYRLPDRHAVEDVVADTYLRALRSIARFVWTGPSSLEAWLVTIARHLAVDRSRAAARVPVPAGLPDEWWRQPTAPPADVAVLQADADRQLVAAVRSLPDDQRDCVVLRFVLELPVSTVARILGRSDGAVKTLQYRAVRALSRQLRPVRTASPGHAGGTLSTGRRGRLAVHRVSPAR